MLLSTLVLVLLGDTDTALRAIRWLLRDEAKAQTEYHNMIADMNNQSSSASLTFCDLFTDKVVRKTIIISLVIAVFIQYSGMDAVLNYGEVIFLDAGFSDEHAGRAMLYVSIVGLLASLVTIYLMEKWGRKILLYISSAMMSAAFIVLGCCLYVMQHSDEISLYMFWAVILSIVFYRSGYLLGWGAAGLLLPAELIPNRARGIGCGIMQTFCWMLSASVSFTYIFMVNAIHDYGTFWFYAGVNFMGIIFVLFFVPETKGKSLEDLENEFKYPDKKSSRNTNTTTTLVYS